VINLKGKFKLKIESAEEKDLPEKKEEEMRPLFSSLPEGHTEIDFEVETENTEETREIMNELLQIGKMLGELTKEPESQV